VPAVGAGTVPRVGPAGALPSALVDRAAIPAGLALLREACPAIGRLRDMPGPARPEDWQEVCTALASGLPAPGAEARFLDRHFTALRLGDGTGLVTGYYAPEVPARAGPMPGLVPVLGPPAGLSCAGDPPPCPARAEIEAGALAGRAPVLAFADPVDLFFLQVQGSGVLRFPDGTTAPVGFAGDNGHPYVAIGRLLRARGLLPPGAGMAEIRAWLRAHPEAGRALMQENPRYIFFARRPREAPVGTLGVPLAPMRVAATDPAHVPLGALVWLESRTARGPLRALLLAADTGAAIRGPNRLDLFTGTGEAAGRVAGPLEARGRIALLLPRAAADRLAR